MDRVVRIDEHRVRVVEPDVVVQRLHLGVVAAEAGVRVQLDEQALRVLRRFEGDPPDGHQQGDDEHRRRRHRERPPKLRQSVE